MSDTLQKAEHLGEITAPSAIVVLVDMGLLDMWCHDKTPVLLDGILASDEETLAANDAVDFHIEGPDADETGREWNCRFIYDIPRHALSQFHEFFNGFIQEHKLKASLSQLGERVSHRSRIDNAIQFGGGAGPFEFHGISAIAVADVPVDKVMQVVGFRMEEEEFCHLWREIQLLVRPESTVVETIGLGVVAVDKARLMFVDADALKHWQHEEPIDGNADFVFWGADVQHVSQKFGARELPANDGTAMYGWEDLEVNEAADLGLSVEEYKESAGLRFATDFRPHSHHYLAMKQVRESKTESGVVTFGAASACAFMTTWGDGYFQVYQDIDSEGRTVRLRIDLGNEQSVANMKAVNS